MSVVNTVPLPVSDVFATSGKTRKLTLVMASPYPADLYIGTIVITCAAGTDVIVPGQDSTHGGKVSWYVDSTVFADLIARVVAPCSVVLTYNTDNHDVISMTVSPGLQAALKSALLPQHDKAAE